MLKSMNFLRGKSRGRVSGDKYDVLCWCLERMLSDFCQFFKYPSPAGKPAPSPAGGEGSRLLRCACNDAATNGEGWLRPWCNKILGTGPSMTGGRGAGFVRLLRRYTPRNDVFNDTLHSALPRHSLPQGAREYGRSMIEMLGVLAIVGVLSVAGIAGYSKAMEKFKVNKLMSEYNMLILGLMEHKASILLPDDDSIDFELGETVKALNLVPENWRLLNEQYLDDGRGNLVNARIGMSSAAPVLVIDFNLGGLSEDESGSLISTTFSNKLCFEMFNTLVYPLRDGLVMGRVFRTGNKEDNRYYSAAYCGGGNKCLQDLNLSDIKRECDACDGKHRCNVTITF